MEVKYKPINILGMDLIQANFKSVEFQLAEFEDLICIYSAESKNRGKGEIQEALAKIRNDYSPKKIFGSVPLNDVMKHIYEKMEIEYDGMPTPDTIHKPNCNALKGPFDYTACNCKPTPDTTEK